MEKTMESLDAEIIEQLGEGESWGVFSVDSLICLCFLMGAVKLFNFLATIFSSFFRRRLNLKERYGGGWALVTGGSEGIGQAIAIELAKSGFDLILVSRNLEKLQKAKQNILKLLPSVKIEVYSIDLQKLTTQAHYEQTFKSLLQKNVSILVNNVGFYNPNKLEQLSFESLRTEMKLNILPIAILTRLFLTKFLKRGKPSGVINLSSGASMMAYGGASHYSATKTFDDFFSRALEYELKGKVDVLTVRPFLVTSSMTKNTTSLTHATPEQIGKQAVTALGNTDICYGPLSHRFQAAMINLVSQWSATKVSTQEMTKFRASLDKLD